MSANSTATYETVGDSNTLGTIVIGSGEKGAFFGATPVVRPTPAVAVGTDLATVILELADLRASLVTLGLITS